MNNISEILTSALGESTQIIWEKESFYQEFENAFPLAGARGINWDQMHKAPLPFTKNMLVERFKSKDCIIIWFETSLPIVIAPVEKVLDQLELILSINFDTWITDHNFSQIIEFSPHEQGKMML